MLKTTASILALALATASHANTLTLTPANPQPKAADLAPGLAVSYAYRSVRSLDQAESALKGGKPGPALVGLSYLDGDEGDKTLTSNQATKVTAKIEGFIRFEAVGTFEVDFISNDGIVASIGGQQVALYDGVHGCEPAGAQSVKVPSAGWYALEATYFQRKGSACLLMDWSVSGEMEPVPDSAFAHLK